MKKLLGYFCGPVLVSIFMAMFASAPAFAQAPAATAPAGDIMATFGLSSVAIPTLGTMAQNTNTMMESESILSLVGQGTVSPAAAVANLNATANAYCGGQFGPQLADCASPAAIAAALAPYVAQLQAAFTLVPLSQWNPLTFTVTGQYASAIQYVNAAAALAATPPTGPAIPQLIVGTCYTVNGINSPSGIECGGADGVTVAMVQALGPMVSQNGQLYSVHVYREMMGMAYYFSPVSN